MMRNIDELTGAAFTMFPLDSNSEYPLDSLFIKSPTNSQLLLPDHHHHQNPNLREEEPSQIFPNFPSPFFDEYELPLNQILPKNLLMAAPDQRSDAATVAAKRPPAKPKVKADAVAPRRRTGKKDRHSKISTAQGIRDRRMRLSLQVARNFFDLQDMLGYDKASKTIEWLFSKSKKAIKELTRDNPYNPLAYSINSMSDTKSESLISDCEVASGINHEISISNTDFPTSGTPQFVEDDKKSSKAAEWKSSVRVSREKARARARCRTREKQMIIKGLENPSPDFQTLGSSNNPFEPEIDFQEESVSINPGDYPSLADVGTIEKLLGTSSGSSPGSNLMGLLGCWDLLNSDMAGYHPISVDYMAAVNSHPNFFPLYHH